MKVSRGRPDIFGNGGGERDDVMLHFRFDRIDAIDRECGFRLDLGRSLFRNDAFLRKHFCGSEFDIEPSLVFVLVLPDVCPSEGVCNVVSLSNYNRIGAVG